MSTPALFFDRLRDAKKAACSDMSTPALFFDRDLTLIAHAPPGLAAPAAHESQHVVLLPGALEALRKARAAGFRVVIVTNQPVPAKGEYSHAQVERTNARLLTLCAQHRAPIDAIFTCEHHPVGGPLDDAALTRECGCHKPGPGLIFRAARELDLDLSHSALIGPTRSQSASSRSPSRGDPLNGSPSCPQAPARRRGLAAAAETSRACSRGV